MTRAGTGGAALLLWTLPGPVKAALATASPVEGARLTPERRHLWADVVHGFPFDGQPKFWELPLDPTISGRGRQRKIILMQALFHTATRAR